MKTDAATPRSARPFFPHAWSIAGRLTLLYLASTALLLTLASGFLYWGLQRSLTVQDNALLTGKIKILQLLLRDHSEKTDMLVNEVEHEAAESQTLKYYLRILDSSGHVQLETPEMQALLPSNIFPPPTAARQLLTGIAWESAAGRTFLVLSAIAVEGGAKPARRVLQVALDVTHNNEILARYRWSLLGVLVVGLLFAAGTGGLVARTGMHPLQQITQQIQRITASKLDDRLTATNWPTELVTLAANFDAMLNRLEDSFARLSQCTGDMAHALRNPINNLRGEAEVALSRVRSVEDYQQVLASSLEEYERLSRLIDNLLFIARADNPAVAVDHVQFTARTEMLAVRDFYEALAAEKQVTVECEGDATVVGDSMLFRRAVSNLLANALKYTSVGGSVVLAARNLSDGAAIITARDTGAGIAPEHLARVFDRFFQVDPSRDQTAHGAGLGLAIVQSVMRLHGGSAMIESTLGQGTTVTLTFPPPQTKAAAASAQW